MWQLLVGIALKLPDWILRLADRRRIGIAVKHLEYDLNQNDPDRSVVLISPYPSRYYTELGVSYSGKPTTIKSLSLVINKELNLEPSYFEPLRLEHGDYREMVVVFPVEEQFAVTEGNFELGATDAFDKVVCRCKGRFPIVPAR